MIVQKSFSGPRACIMAPKVPIESKNAMMMVRTMTNPKTWNMMTCAKSSQNPQPIVVILPLKILTPISLYDCLILSSLFSPGECI